MLGFGTISKKVFGTPNDRKIKATRPLVDQINALSRNSKSFRMKVWSKKPPN